LRQARLVPTDCRGGAGLSFGTASSFSEASYTN
jgi:hypothetical protein